MKATRIQSFSDGVFAILITLLIEKPCAWALKKLFTRKQKA